MTDIVIPCVDQSSLKTKDINNFINNIKSIISLAEYKDINLCLETDLAPLPSQNLLEFN